MDIQSIPDNFEEERFFETGYEPVAGKFLFIDITVFSTLLKPCFEAATAKLRKVGVDKLLASEDWIEHHVDKATGKRVLSESSLIEHKHELHTARALAQKDYDVLFAPQRDVSTF